MEQFLHVFISYSHQDVNHRNALVSVLKEAGISYWVDEQIAGGRDWRDEIDTALEESFALVVIVTSDSMDSHPVTYEWSWAIGNGIPVIALLFEDEKKIRIHHALARKQWILCHEGIPDYLVETLKEYQETPRDLEYLSQQVMEAIMPFRILLRVSLWLHSHVDIGSPEYSRTHMLTEKMLDEALDLRNTLPNLMTSRYGFSSKQKRKCRVLTRNLLSLWQSFHIPTQPTSAYHLSRRPEDIRDVAAKAEIYRRDDIEPVVSFFDTKHHYVEKFEFFDRKLKAIDLRSDEFLWDATMIVRWCITDEKLAEMIEDVISKVEQQKA